MANNKENNSNNYNNDEINNNEDNENNETNTTINYNAIITSQLTQGGKDKNGWSAKGIELYNNMFPTVVVDQKNNGKAFDISFRKNYKNEKTFLPLRTDNKNNDLTPTDAANCL